jgi:heme/copper-type cytochrome/quinol oxidase subunit 3
MSVFTHTLRVKKRAHSHNQFNRENKNLDLSFSIGLFSSLFLYSVSFIPYLILLIIDYEDKLSRTLHLYGRVFILINSC